MEKKSYMHPSNSKTVEWEREHPAIVSQLPNTMEPKIQNLVIKYIHSKRCDFDKAYLGKKNFIQAFNVNREMFRQENGNKTLP